MARTATEYQDGWPMMAPLGKKEQALLDQNLVADERVLGQVIANFGQALIATDHKVLIVKTGLMSGQTFGGKATAFDYRTIVGIEVRTGLAQGELELLSAGIAAPQRNNNSTKVDVAQLPNALVFTKSESDAFNAIAAKIRERNAAALSPAPSAPTPAADPIEQIKRLGELRDAGVLTPEEFEAKKAELLSQI